VQALPADWARLRDRWQIAHAVRTVAIVLALGYLSAAILDRPVPGMPERTNKALPAESRLDTMRPPAPTM
jgi:hypothetical protein